MDVDLIYRRGNLVYSVPGYGSWLDDQDGDREGDIYLEFKSLCELETFYRELGKALRPHVQGWRSALVQEISCLIQAIWNRLPYGQRAQLREEHALRLGNVDGAVYEIYSVAGAICVSVSGYSDVRRLPTPELYAVRDFLRSIVLRDALRD